jgi:hypothetical protein
LFHILRGQDTRAQPTEVPSSWQRIDSQHFEIYLPALAPELSRVVRGAERAYDQISGQLNFAFSTKVPLVMFIPSGPITQEQVRAFAGSNQVAPLSPHRSRLVLARPKSDAQLDPLILHELTHFLVSEMVWAGEDRRRRNAALD